MALFALSSRESHGITPTCSVVIPTRDRPEQLDRCLESVAKLSYPEFSVLVVDSAPRNDRARHVAERWGARYIQEPVLGASRARNRGARSCETGIVAFLEDDAVPEPGWLFSLVREFADARVIAVTGRVEPLGVDAATEQLCAVLGICDVGGPEPWIIDRNTPLWFEIACFGGVGIGSNMAFRREAFEVWPGFDDRLGPGRLLGNEEHYAFFALIERGYRVAYTPHAVVRHPLDPRPPAHLRARYLRQVASAAGFMTLMFFEETRHRRDLLKFVAEGLRRKPRGWRQPSQMVRPPFASWWRVMLAALTGPWLYLRTRFKGPQFAAWP